MVDLDLKQPQFDCLARPKDCSYQCFRRLCLVAAWSSSTSDSPHYPIPADNKGILLELLVTSTLTGQHSTCTNLLETVNETVNDWSLALDRHLITDAVYTDFILKSI